MNKLTLFLNELSGGREVEKDGIVFSNVSIVGFLIDDESLEDVDWFKDSLLYFDELRNSVHGSGRYLIFTCACGIAEDGGWEGVIVTHDVDEVIWEIEVGFEILKYVFDKRQYCDEIERLRIEIEASHLPMEPGQVIFPFNFKR